MRSRPLGYPRGLPGGRLRDPLPRGWFPAAAAHKSLGWPPSRPGAWLTSNRLQVEKPRPRRWPFAPPCPAHCWRRGRGRAVAESTSSAMDRLQRLRPTPAPCSSKSPPERPLQVKVVGIFKSSNFQVAKSTAESLKMNYPSKFEDPIMVPLQEFAWYQYLQEKKRELKDETWEYSSNVMCFINDKFLGDASDLQKWAHKVWDIVDIKPPALYEALTVDFSTKFLRDTKHVFVFLDIKINFYPIGRLIFELYCDVCPKTCKNFQFLCTGRAGFSQSGIRLHYKDSIIHRVVQNGWIQGGDIVAGRGDNGESIYGPTFEDENFSVPHNRRGVLGMVNQGHHTNGSQFYITLQAAPYLDKKYVAFGQLIEGTEVLQQLESVPTENERPIYICTISDSGDAFV
ncbi:putative inactive peptidyl-prolyl cis-trans isomerase-like 6 [Callospermophilus lateralis]|uniref:putative inactive peptidyl-prolyl cis-trans isomerase-like 6 n=1 Tax=Callospermophilus lateralis TaxID=76772 RepID=UPI004053E201